MILHDRIYSRRFFRGTPGLIFIIFVVCLGGGCDRGPRGEGGKALPESFLFMDIGVNTVVDAEVISRLNQALGAEAVDKRTPISLEIKYKGFLKRYYPELAELEQELNINDVVRKEYPATKLTFRYPQQRQSIFDYVELIYANRSGHPLVIKMIAKKEVPDLIQSVTEKFGSPQEILLAEGEGTSRSWRQHQDVFVITRFAGRYGKPEQHIMIVYAERLRQLLQQEAAQSGYQKKQDAGSVFK
ncbi:MAG: hypothetical protein ACOZF0_01310 [Thermodesulfobacteriota bacterium]